EGQKVQVQVSAPAFDVLNEARQETEIRPDADSPPLVFDLRPRRVGHTQITFDFFQRGNPVGTVAVPIECTPEVGARAVPCTPSPLRFDQQSDPPDLVLLIERHGPPPVLQFTLIQGGGVLWHRFSPVPLKGDPASHADEVYRHMTAVTIRTDPASAVHDGFPARILPSKNVDRLVRAAGNNLWR